jgi:TRAP transporter TAXI family solute receptor
LISIVYGLWFYGQKSGQWEQVRIATATRGGTFNELGAQLARILERLPGKPIKHASAEPTRGSRENIQCLNDSQAEIALVQGPILIQAFREQSKSTQSLRVLARLYRDVVHIVVRKDMKVETIADLEGKKIYIGAEGSGTRILAMNILEVIGFSEEKYTIDDAVSYDDAADRLIHGDLDAAIFASGIPTEAVIKALDSGHCKLLSLLEDVQKRLTKLDSEIGLDKAFIPASFYKNQLASVRTVSADVFLVCKSDFPEDLASLILQTIFDNVSDLLLVHTIAQDIKLTKAFDILNELTLHSGAMKFQAKEAAILLIATGAIGGKYYNTGKTIQLLLRERGIETRLVHSDGSIENAKLMREQPTIAIMQYDAALSSRFGQPKFVYNMNLSEENNIPTIENIRRIAALHKEVVHIIIRRDKLASIEKSLNKDYDESAPIRIASLDKLAEAIRKPTYGKEKLRVCLGARESGTQVVAQVILKHHGIDSTLITQSFLSVPDMVNRIHSGEIDMGFFISFVPSGAIKTILNMETVKLLSMGLREQSEMTGTVFSASTIEGGRYGCQLEEEKAIQTIATWAVLVTTADLPFDVDMITRAIFEGEIFLGMDNGVKGMATDLSSLPLHAKTRRYYQEAGILPSKPPIDWLGMVWRALASLMIVIGGYNGLIIILRDRTSNRIGRRIIAIPLNANVPDSVERLLLIRDEMRKRITRRWWRIGELDKHRWRSLDELINTQIQKATDNLTRAIVSMIRKIGQDDSLNDEARLEHLSKLRKQIWTYFRDRCLMNDTASSKFNKIRVSAG